MSTYFECHITMTGDRDLIRPLVESCRWKFSAIDGDIQLGDGLKCYATRQFNARRGEQSILDELLATADMLSAAGCNVVRRKVERVLYDDRSTKVRCTGGCVECHLDDLCKEKL